MSFRKISYMKSLFDDFVSDSYSDPPLSPLASVTNDIFNLSTNRKTNHMTKRKVKNWNSECLCLWIRNYAFYPFSVYESEFAVINFLQHVVKTGMELVTDKYDNTCLETNYGIFCERIKEYLEEGNEYYMKSVNAFWIYVQQLRDRECISEFMKWNRLFKRLYQFCKIENKLDDMKFLSDFCDNLLMFEYYDYAISGNNCDNKKKEFNISFIRINKDKICLVFTPSNFVIDSNNTDNTDKKYDEYDFNKKMINIDQYSSSSSTNDNRDKDDNYSLIYINYLLVPILNSKLKNKVLYKMEKMKIKLRKDKRFSKICYSLNNLNNGKKLSFNSNSNYRNRVVSNSQKNKILKLIKNKKLDNLFENYIHDYYLDLSKANTNESINLIWNKLKHQRDIYLNDLIES